MFSEWIKRTIPRDLKGTVTQSLWSLKQSGLDYLLVYNVKSLPLFAQDIFGGILECMNSKVRGGWEGAVHRGYFVRFSARAWVHRSDRTSAATLLDSLATDLSHFYCQTCWPYHLPDHQLFLIPDQFRAAGGRQWCSGGTGFLHRFQVFVSGLIQALNLNSGLSVTCYKREDPCSLPTPSTCCLGLLGIPALLNDSWFSFLSLSHSHYPSLGPHYLLPKL